MKNRLPGYDEFVQKGLRQLNAEVKRMIKEGYKEVSTEKDLEKNIHTLIYIAERIPHKEYYIDETRVEPSSTLSYDSYLEGSYDEQRYLPYNKTSKISVSNHNPFAEKNEDENQPGNC